MAAHATTSSAQLTADACSLPVFAGPVEATALGNVLVQARSLGVDLPDLASMRALVGATHPTRRFEPSRDGSDWDAAGLRLTAGTAAGYGAGTGAVTGVASGADEPRGA